MLPKTTSVTIRGDLEQRVTASGRLGASSVPVTPPPAATLARSATPLGHAGASRVDPDAGINECRTAACLPGRGSAPVGEKRDPARKPCVEQSVDDAANWVAPPTPLSRAAHDAVGMALGLEGLVLTTAAALVVATRWQLCRIRYSQWDCELGRVLRR